MIYKTALPLEAFIGVRAHHQPRHAALQREGAADQDLEDIYAYLESLPKPPDYKTIPLLNQ